MRVAIDIRKLRDYGIGTYVRNIVVAYRPPGHRERVRADQPPGGPGVHPVASARTSAASSARPATTRVREQFSIPVDRAPRARGRLPRAALRAAAARVVSVGRDHPRLHPPDVPAVPAEPAGLHLRAHVHVDGDTPLLARPDGLGGLQARHPALLPHPGRQDHGGLQRHRRAVQPRCRSTRTSRGPRSDSSSTTRSCCTWATSGHTRTSSG